MAPDPPAATSPGAPAPPTPEAPAGLPRIEIRIERLRIRVRFTWAFHARAVRFERDAGSGWESLFPETFSFHADRHDPAELYLQLEDLWSNPRLLAENAHRRDSEELTARLLARLPAKLAEVLDRLEARAEAAGEAYSRACEDAAVFTQIASRFLREHSLREDPRLRLAGFHLRRVGLRALRGLVDTRVSPAYVAAYVDGSAPRLPSVDPNDVGFFYALASDDRDVIDRTVMASAERAFYRWVEDVCLELENQAFETENSPFGEREIEVRDVIATRHDGPLDRGQDLSIFLRRPGNRDCQRLLRKLETYFLRQYDVGLAAAMRHHAAQLAKSQGDPERTLSWHSRTAYLLVLGLPTLPFLAAIFFYQDAPQVFDWIVSVEVVAATAGAFWFLAYQFLWKRDLVLFHSSVPRIAAGIIVGYLPVFLIDEVWDLAEQSLLPLGTVIFLLGSTTLLYLYVEVQRQLGERPEAFARAFDLFLLGITESAAFGLVVTTLLGPLMAVRNWGAADLNGTVAQLRPQLEPFVGELPRVLGIEPFYCFPTAVLLMTVLAFFIGTFLQLLWEDLPITEPM